MIATQVESDETSGGGKLNLTLKRWFIWGGITFFFINLLGVIGTVVISSFGQEWFSGWLPHGWTTSFYKMAWQNYQVYGLLRVTLEIALTVVLISIALGAPAAYALARRNFPGKKFVMLCFLLPIMLPPITYGIPLATFIYKLHLGGKILGVIVVNLVPAIPFVILVLTPFIEQIDPKIEAAARMCGAKTHQIFLKILMPLIVPGLLAAGLLVLVQTVALFELTYLVSGPGSTTLVVALYYAVFASGIRPYQAISAMAVFYMLTTLFILILALRYVNPTQMVTQANTNRNTDNH
jgi:putative spermidine/putrescine transport system permease protein